MWGLSHTLHANLASLPPEQGSVGTAHLKSTLSLFSEVQKLEAEASPREKSTKNRVHGCPGGTSQRALFSHQTHSRSDHSETQKVKAASRSQNGTHHRAGLWIMFPELWAVSTMLSSLIYFSRSPRWSRKCCHWNHETFIQPIKQSLTWASLHTQCSSKN